MRVVDIDNPAKEMPVGERSELMYKGPMGYFGNEQGTKETVEADGWLHTGDIATMDEDAKILNRVYKRNAIKVRPVRPKNI
jgi:long-chain acyl-CoA synthetase